MITRRETFNHLVKWLSEVRENASNDITIILIGNKNDLEDKRQVSIEEGESFASENNLLFLETSAKTSNNIAEAFNLSAIRILNNIQNTGEELISNNNIKINNDKGNINEKDKNNNNKKKCC